MIYFLQGGRCGNQLFAYAITKVISKYYPNEDVCFDYSAINGKSNGNYWEDSLQQFILTSSYKTFPSNNSFQKKASFLQKIILFKWKLHKKIIEKKSYDDKKIIYEKMFKKMSRFGLYFLPYGYANFKISKSKNKFIWGSFENPLWFDSYREELLSELQPKKINHENNKLFGIIKKSNSICVSFRNWSIDVKNSEIDNRNVCDKEYYINAIKEILKLIPNPVFIVFSDDVSKGINFFKEYFPNLLVYAESGTDIVSEKLRLMSSCKNFILSNSTFAWWAQYLCNYDNKIVISPKYWLRETKNISPLNDKDWILI